MEWTVSLKRAIDYMESHLLESIDAGDVAKQIYMSSFYFQKGFKIMTGYSVGEYIRCRRLYLAALDVIAGRDKIIDLAYKYGYDTPESFTKAFSRFHGCPPTQLKNDTSLIKVFLPLKITVTIQGGNDMDYVIEKMDAMKMIGFEKSFSFDNSYETIPRFWTEFCTTCQSGKYPDDVHKVIEDCMVGEFAICLDNMNDGKNFKYLIAGNYDGGHVPEGMTVCEIPAHTWVKFKCVGPLPGSLQSINTKIFKEWLPGNPDYELADGLNIEWYSLDDGSSPDYESQIWLPVNKK